MPATMKNCAKAVSKSLKHYHRAGNPYAICQFAKQYAKEHKEHPSFTRKQIIQIVKDHARKR